ncbi:hypothetical protein POJ06DRAFT_292774 [Lipomyces tetrasporus]|uniref:Uncharacterized protein n=1 Tax=Lipomyces tetrasporus TaxID=54092 RepID=A0AAD7QMW1_9ASCO|nr:uncharacterized protein POJ06DRAFT_292774 [Lipomyces tetrasporus]KAJ8098128.1 hypothetical protein POJ06DRAFT_292774 [Lipomyces tetrasporus]
MNMLYGEEESRSRHLVTAAIGTARANTSQAAMGVEGAAKSQNKEYKDQAVCHTSVVLQTSMSLEMPLRHNEQASYQRALNFLMANEPEKRLDVCLSPKSFQFLDEQAHALYGDAKYPRVQYSALDSRVIITTIPTALHSRSASGLQGLISRSVRDTLIRLNKGELSDDVVLVGDSEYSIVDDQGRFSRKTPDGGLTYSDEEGKEALTIVIEAGFSESYQQLKRDVKLWLNQFECHTAMIIFSTENPSFRSPTNEGNNTCSVTERGLFESAMEHTQRVNSFGPYCFGGHTWFGTMATATIEVLKKNPTTGRIKSKKQEVVRTGQMMVQGDSVDVGLTIGDAFPPNHVAIEDIREEPVLLATHLVRKFLVSGARRTAETRFFNFFGK